MFTIIILISEHFARPFIMEGKQKNIHQFPSNIIIEVLYECQSELTAYKQHMT